MSDVLKPNFSDKYGHHIPYKKDQKFPKISAFWGIIWLHDIRDNVVFYNLSARPYSGTGPARQWVNRECKYFEAPYRRNNYKILDAAVITADEWKLLD